jgi:uncharacterized protein (DUF1697 family)
MASKSQTYIALLRGINVGTTKRLDMQKLKVLLESMGHTNVVTYINSGNVIFQSTLQPDAIRAEMEKAMKKSFGHEISTLIKSAKEMQQIVDAIPAGWKNDTAHRTDVAYLFEEIDSKKVIGELPFKTEFIDVRYTKGALIWHVDRKNYNKSHLNKLIGHKYYQLMTVRNVNTARKLVEMVGKGA